MDMVYFFGLGIFDVESCTWNYPAVGGKPPVPRTNHAIAACGNKKYSYLEETIQPNLQMNAVPI